MAGVRAVTTYFNPGRFRSKRANYERFRERLAAQGVALTTIECAFDGEFELGAECMRVEGGDVMWQKERLLNIAFSSLPAACDKVAWLDCDILFERDDWADATAAQLDEFAIVQPFSEVARLPAGVDAIDARANVVTSFAALTARGAPDAREPIFDRHGHTGYAWAARRELLTRHGLYDACVAGGADHAMAHAVRGEIESPCVRRLLGAATPLLRHFSAWAASFGADTGGAIGCCEGRIAHLWHGAVDKRGYLERQRTLAALEFDPARDLRAEGGEPWRWSGENPGLARWAGDYFRSRDEDAGLP